MVNLASPATVKIYSGDSTQSWDLQAGLAKLKVPSKAGAIGGEITRDGKAVLAYDSKSAGWAYTDTPADYNFNYFVGEAYVCRKNRLTDSTKDGGANSGARAVGPALGAVLAATLAALIF